MTNKIVTVYSATAAATTATTSDREAQLRPQAPHSVFIAFYDSQGYGTDILTHLITGDIAHQLKQK
jgi:hypothetical protein